MPNYDGLIEAWIMMCAIETAVAHQDTYPARGDEYGPSLAQLIDEGHTTTGMKAAHGHHLRVLFTSALYHDVWRGRLHALSNNAQTDAKPC